MRLRAAAVAAGLLLGAPACARSPDRAAPPGSRDNPIVCTGRPDVLAYLARLRCPDGTAPHWRRSGSVRAGPYGSTQEQYVVRCVRLDWETHLYFDRQQGPLDGERAPTGLELAPAVPTPTCRTPGRCT